MGAIRTQLAYLRDRAEAIANGAQKLDGTLRQRASLYALSAKATFWDIVGKVKGEDGYTVEWNVRNAMDSCPGCLTETARGEVPIGELVPIGERDCLGHCMCEIQYGQKGDSA